MFILKSNQKPRPTTHQMDGENKVFSEKKNQKFCQSFGMPKLQLFNPLDLVNVNSLPLVGILVSGYQTTVLFELYCCVYRNDALVGH